MTAPTTSPDTSYYLDQQRVLRAAVDRAQAAWRELPAGTDGHEVWTGQVRPELVSAVEQAQADSVSLAPLYVAATIAAAGAVSAPLGALVTRAWVGYATTGLPLAALADFAYRHYQRSLALGVAPSEARTMGLARLLRYVATETADAGRLASTAAAVLEPEIVGYERGVHLPACGRCIQLAGRLYRYSTGFLRHPNCDCIMHPVTRDRWRTNRPTNTPHALFDQMTSAQQDKAFGIDAATAIRAGADISRVVNARRHGAVYTAGGHEYTHEATTVRGVGRRLGDLTKRGRRYRTTGVARPTPAQLVNTARNEAELTMLLRQFGYLA